MKIKAKQRLREHEKNDVNNHLKLQNVAPLTRGNDVWSKHMREKHD